MTTTRIRCGDESLSVSETGSGRPLLLVHGFPLDHTMWRGQIDGLSELCRVIAPDLRGFGQSDATNGTVKMEQFADDMAALLDQLGITEPITFCGLSMGGYVGWQFSQRHRSRVARLIMCDTRAIADTAEVAGFRRETAERALNEGAAVIESMMTPKLFAESTVHNQQEIVERTRHVMLETAPHGIAAALLGMAVRPDVTRMLPNIDVPTLVICGQHDVISTPVEMRGIAASIPNASFVEITGAGHMAPLEQPALVNTAIREFLQVAK